MIINLIQKKHIYSNVIVDLLTVENHYKSKRNNLIFHLLNLFQMKNNKIEIIKMMT